MSDVRGREGGGDGEGRGGEGTALRGRVDMQTACVAAALASKEHRASVTKRFSKYGIG